MRHGRAKAARRTLQFYRRTQGIRPPYHILLDGTFVFAIVKYKLPLKDRLYRLLQHAALHLHITKTSLQELQRLEQQSQKSEQQELLREARTWAVQNCEQLQDDDDNDADGPSPRKEQESKSRGKDSSAAAQDILRNVSHEESKYFLASQDEELLHIVRTGRSTAGVPILRLARGSVLLLEQPSKAASQHATIQERRKWTVAATVHEKEKELVDLVKQQQRRQEQQHQQDVQHQQHARRRKPKAKGPNPLSCKKKKRSADTSTPTGQETHASKRRRRRKTNNDTPSSS